MDDCANLTRRDVKRRKSGGFSSHALNSRIITLELHSHDPAFYRPLREGRIFLDRTPPPRRAFSSRRATFDMSSRASCISNRGSLRNGSVILSAQIRRTAVPLETARRLTSCS